MTILNRETYRKYLAGLLSEACVGDGKPAEALFEYAAGDFGGKSPVVTVISAGTELDKRAVTSRQKTTFYYTIYAFVVFALPDTAWGEDDVEDRLDLLEKTIRETVAANKSNDYWADIKYDGRTVVDNVMIAGEEYRREAIPISVEVYED